MKKIITIFIAGLAGCSSTTIVDRTVVDSGSTVDAEDVADSNNDIGIDSGIIDAHIVKDSSITCGSNTILCGDQCIPIGNTCCSSVGLPGMYCPNGGTCNPDGICTGNCKVDNNLSCSGGYTAYSCTGSVQPKQIDNNLYCGSGTVGVGQTVYCCVEQCSAPKGTYKYTYTTLTGNCGDVIVDGPVIFNGNSNLDAVAAGAELCEGTNQTLKQDTNNISIDACSGSVSSTCNGFDNSDLISAYSVVSITSSQDGRTFGGNVSLTVTDKTTNTQLCSGTYSFSVTWISQ